MRFFLDTEFMEDGEQIRPLSIGIVSERFHALYIVVTDAKRDLANDFVRKNVLPHIDTAPPPGVLYLRLAQREVGAAILDWMEGLTEEPPEFWADYGAYDWVLFCQLWGNMTDLPEGFPMFVRDVEQFRHDVGWDGPFPHEEERNHLIEPEHNAINDAYATLQRWAFLTALVEARDTELTPEAFVEADLLAFREKHPSGYQPKPSFPEDGSMETAP